MNRHPAFEEIRPFSRNLGQPPEPPKLSHSITNAFSHQHFNMDCFAHAATHIIFITYTI
jgi:hypothetical protein